MEISIEEIEKEIRQFLKEVEEGKIKLSYTQDPQDVYAGNVTYHASNGWTIVIFNDCNEWDYIDEIICPGRFRIDYDELEDKMPATANYIPNDEISWKRYRIPGHSKFRCINCDEIFKKGKHLVEHSKTCSAEDLK